MRGGPGLRQKLGTSLTITPQLQQAIKLLQLSNIELQDYVDREIAENPVLERAGSDRSDTDASDGGDYRDGLDEGPPATASDDEDAVAWGSGGRNGFETGGGVGETLADTASLRQFLDEQIGIDVADSVERAICRDLIDSLDDAGYLTEDLSEIAKRLGCARERVEGALTRLQACEPAGIAARDLRECLALQLAERGRLDAPMQRLLDNLDLIARRDLASLASRCGLDEDAVVAHVRTLRSLDPKPGASFENGPVRTVVPDVYVRREGGDWAVSLNVETLPRLLIDRRYRALAGRGTHDAADRIWLRERLQWAKWLVRALDQRATTILKIATELVRQQESFLNEGVYCLKPLTLRDIAEQVSLHESTVSRVTGNKFMATPRGTFELKYFFSPAIPGADGGVGHSAEAVRHRIRALIDAEPASRVLSDDRLVALLRESGVRIARRTIAKYRESLNIPSSVQRRRVKSARL